MPLRVPTSGIVLVSCLSGKGCVGHCDAVGIEIIVASRRTCRAPAG